MQQAVRTEPLVAVTRPTLPGDGLARLAETASLRLWSEHRPPTLEELVDLADGAEVLLCLNGDPLSAELFDRCPELKLIVLASVGYDSVDVSAAAVRGIQVTTTPGVLQEATADLAFGLILAARRRIAEADRSVRAGAWDTNSLDMLVGYDVHSTQLGIVGYGAIGRAVARRASGFAMTVRHHSRTRVDDDLSGWLGLDELLTTSDIVSLHAPLSDATRGLIGERELRLMKPTATLVNTARGGVIDEPALVRALAEGWIHSAGLDVQSVEPNPDRTNPLLGLENCVVLPHIGSASVASREAQIALAVDNVLAHLDGRALVTPLPALAVS